MKTRKTLICFFIYVFLIILSFFLCVYFGSVTISWSEILSSDQITMMIIKTRAIESVQSIYVGFILAFCGSVLQRLLRNPLADPFILGITSGGTSFTAFFFFFNLSGISFLENLNQFFPLSWLVSFIGCMASFFLLMYFKNRMRYAHDEYIYPLIGVVINTFFASLTMAVVAFFREDQILKWHHWFLGTLQPTSWEQLLGIIGISIFPIAYILKKSLSIKNMSFGDDFALSMGQNPEHIRKQIIIHICFLVALSVSMCGMIGFVGLIVPHVIKKIHRLNFVNEFLFSAFGGSVLMALADLCSRTIYAPAQLPIGIFTALIGSPALAFLILQRQKKTGHS